MMRGFISWIFSHGNPIRSIAPGAKFSTMTSHSSMSLVKIAFPASVLGFRVTLRLFALSIVK